MNHARSYVQCRFPHPDAVRRPDTDRLSDRDWAMFLDHIRGDTFRAIAAKNNLSVTRPQHIISRVGRMVEIADRMRHAREDNA